MNDIKVCKLPFFYRDAAADVFLVAPPYILNYYQVARVALPAPHFIKYSVCLSLYGKVYRIGGGGGGWWHLCNF